MSQEERLLCVGGPLDGIYVEAPRSLDIVEFRASLTATEPGLQRHPPRWESFEVMVRYRRMSAHGSRAWMSPVALPFASAVEMLLDRYAKDRQ